MDKHVISVFAAILALSTVAGVGVFSTAPVQGQNVMVKEIAAPVPVMPVRDQMANFTKIVISPRYGNLRLQVGENREITVTVRNKETKAVSVRPMTVIAPYGEYVMDKDWITVTPESAEIPAGESQKFTIKVQVPEDATRGYYNAQIVFTDEVMPTPYPSPYPSYIHAFQLSVDVWAPPRIQIMTPYINDQVEAGKEYDYEIKLKNTANEA